jgi:hypothetical protein
VPAHDILRIPEHGFGKPEERAYNHAMEVLGVGPDETWMVGDNLEWEIVAPQRLGIYAVWHDGYGVGLPLDSPIRPGPHHPPLVGIAAVAELLGAPAFFARIAPRRSGNLVRADAAHARHNAGRLPHDHPKSTTDPKFPGDLRTSKSVPNPAGGPCLPDY